MNDQFVAWVSQLNTTYSPLTNISGNSGSTVQPGGAIYGDDTAPTINGSMLVSLSRFFAVVVVVDGGLIYLAMQILVGH